MPDDRITCLACGKPIDDDAPTYPDVSGCLCEGCAPTYADLLTDEEPSSFVDLESGEPLSAEERRAIHDKHIAAGGKPTCMAEK